MSGLQYASLLREKLDMDHKYGEFDRLGLSRSQLRMLVLLATKVRIILLDVMGEKIHKAALFLCGCLSNL